MLVRFAHLRFAAPLQWTVQSVDSRQKLPPMVPLESLCDGRHAQQYAARRCARVAGSGRGDASPMSRYLPGARPATLQLVLRVRNSPQFPLWDPRVGLWRRWENSFRMALSPSPLNKPPIVDQHAGNEASAASTVNVPKAAGRR